MEKFQMPYRGAILQPQAILNFYKEHPKVKVILEKPERSAIDICCLYPQYLYHLYHYFGFRTLVGVEGKSMQYVIESALNDSLRLDPILYTRNIYKLYSTLFAVLNEEYFHRYSLLSEDEFSAIFNLKFNVDPNLIIKEFTTKFDLLLLNNVIHIPDERYKSEAIFDSEFFNDCISLIEVNGLIYIKVNHEDNSVVQSVNQVPFNEDNFKSLVKENFEEIYFRVVYGYDSTNGKKYSKKMYMIYLGSKK